MMAKKSSPSEGGKRKLMFTKSTGFIKKIAGVVAEPASGSGPKTKKKKK